MFDKNLIPQFMERKRFDYNTIEPRIIEFWQDEKIYACEEIDPDATKLIDTPPPFANGKLHHGHGMSYSQLDMIARYLRQHYPTLLPLAFDDNGLPTERFTEIKYDIQPGEHPDDFFQLCKNEAEIALKSQQEQFDRMGFSYNHQISYTTLDDRSTRITQEDFISLHQNGYINRELEPQLFCTRCQTALAQADLETATKETDLYYIRFPTIPDDNDLTIATTRPELIPAATAIFYHPDDERYNSRELTISNPINGSSLPLFAEEEIDPDFGSGLMMVATFGDQQDIELYRRYQLDLKPILGSDGKFTAPSLLKGKSISDGRRTIIQHLSDKGYLKKQERVEHSYPICERCDTAIEIINTKQWSIDILSIKDDLLQYIEDLQITPSHMRKRLINWIKGLKWNWIISRQRIYGIPIPAWLCQSCDNVKIATIDQLPLYHEQLENTKPTCGKCGAQMEADDDIFDTWMTSSLTPQILSDKYYNDDTETPLTLRSQAHEIIRTWAFYSLVKHYLRDNKSLPWKNLLISGWGLGFKSKGKRAIKASKSSGTGFNPIDLIEEHGADAFRYWAAQARLGKDQYLMEAHLNRGKKLVTKMYNATKITLILTEDNKSDSKEIGKDSIEEYIQYRNTHLYKIEGQYNSLMENFNYTDALELIEHDFWDNYCSTWIEELKDMSREAGLSQSIQSALRDWLHRYLRMFAPILPFISEYLNIILWSSSDITTPYRSIHLRIDKNKSTTTHP